MKIAGSTGRGASKTYVYVPACVEERWQCWRGKGRKRGETQRRKVGGGTPGGMRGLGKADRLTPAVRTRRGREAKEADR